MSKNHYKVFFTISFLYQIDSKKKISKSFKSDLDINADNINCELNNENVHLEWPKYALKLSLNDLNPPSMFDDKKASEKKIVTHRIVNLMSLTEVHKKY